MPTRIGNTQISDPRPSPSRFTYLLQSPPPKIPFPPYSDSPFFPLSRLQAQDPLHPRYKGMVDCMRRSVTEEGYMVLWRGLAATVVRAFPVNGAIFAVYTFSMGYLDKYF